MRSVFLALVFVAAIACSSKSESTGPSGASIVGSWTLQTVAGAPLPYLLDQNGADKTEMTADAMTFLSSGQFTQVTQMRFTVAGQVNTQAVPQAGTFSANGGNVALQFAGSDSVYTGAVSGTTFTLQFQGLAMVYRK